MDPFDECLEALCKSNGKCTDRIREAISRDEQNIPRSTICKQEVATLLLNPEFTDDVAKWFSPYLLDLLSSSVKEKHDNSAMCLALSKLIHHPDASRFAVGYFETNPNPLSNAANGDEISLHLMEAAYWLIVIGGFRWDWKGLLHELKFNQDPEIKWLCCQCLAMLVPLSEHNKRMLLSKIVDPVVDVQMTLQYHTRWQQRLQLPPTVGYGGVPGRDNPASSPNVGSISGIQLPIITRKQQPELLVSVPSTWTHLRSLSLAVSRGVPVCLVGPVGSGKTSLVEHLAHFTGHNHPPSFCKVQLGSHTDSRVLLGSYHCTNLPGKFVWKPGVVTQAVLGGDWLLLEDIDLAPMDVISVLVPLLENRTLTLPGQTITAHSGFQLFATQRTSTVTTHNPSRLINKLWTKIHVEPLSREELKTVIHHKHHVLTSVCDRLLDVFCLVSSDHYEGGRRDTRIMSIRDLLKWCSRISEEFDVSSIACAITVFQDAYHLFCQHIASQESRCILAQSIGSLLNVLKEKVSFYCNAHKPSVDVSLVSITIGRVTLPRCPVKTIRNKRSSTKSSFCFTRQAAVLCEQVSMCIRHEEPVLLVGETGTGKTSTVQFLAQQTGHPLIVINMNQQSETTDLLGGYKPIEVKFLLLPLREEFELLFTSTFNREKNHKFLRHIVDCFSHQRWNDLLNLMLRVQLVALNKCREETELLPLIDDWKKLGVQIHELKVQLKENALMFSFAEGSLVRALKNGDWVLLDEINLASPETLDCLSGVLEGSKGHLCLLERGDSTPVERHTQFRLFACMNPATDVGKKELTSGIRSRFTELFVDDLTDESDLRLLAADYLSKLTLTPNQLQNLVKFYMIVRKQEALTDGTGRRPHYSLRSFCRALRIASMNLYGSPMRSLYESFCLSFLTQLSRKSYVVIKELIVKHVLGKGMEKTHLNKPIPKPPKGNYSCFEGYWLHQGSEELRVPKQYILTDSVRGNLKDLARAVSAGQLPVLIQGETSVGKTSLITYLAQASGNRCVRVNNHEHTDLQEYIGTYAADQETGKLMFRYGVLARAMLHGYWLILDELNLAPTDVLEALNRVLDDNRELYIVETQETIRAHPRFMLFATQNPPGLYGGRKVLSRAFLNRFIEIHFDEIPPVELCTILHLRCALPQSQCKKMVDVMQELKMRRRGSAAFAGKWGYMTLRDLFRWGQRYQLAPTPEISSGQRFYDWNQHVADEGYLVLAGRVRREEESDVIREVLEKHLKRKVDPENLFSLHEGTSQVTIELLEQVMEQNIPGFEHIVWTRDMRQLAVLVGKSFSFHEPVLLVGETGCGKTTMCQLMAALYEKQLHVISCHMHSEGADFLGGIRPVRHTDGSDKNKLFEWVDGPLVLALRRGDIFLADEVSLAADSVLERLNSVLESERSLVLYEKGGGECLEVIPAADGFRFIATMNPGGDYGKKELSPALRNRLSEIWCPLSKTREDLEQIIHHNLRDDLKGSGEFSKWVMDFVQWFTNTHIGKRCIVSIRDLLAWVSFVNVVCGDKSTDTSKNLNLATGYVHGASLVFLDALGAGLHSAQSVATLSEEKKLAVEYLKKQVSALEHDEEMETDNMPIYKTDVQFGIKPFFIQKGPLPITDEGTFMFSSPSSASNCFRLLRAMQVDKPILLEGSSGVGKTSLVQAMAREAGYKLVRINLSEQTDVSDLFGSDLPEEGGEAGRFSWRDGPLLMALREGHWIVLDEMNLASQSVLEGLNAILDHRGEVFVPELCMTFSIRSTSSRIFACQNPMSQGGDRKGLPKSFTNRFTQVFMDPLSTSDLELILHFLYPLIPLPVLRGMVSFNSQLHQEVVIKGSWGHKGGPWEFNLRDMGRWCQLMLQEWEQCHVWEPCEWVGLIYQDRMRTNEDRDQVSLLCTSTLGCPPPPPNTHLMITPSFIQVGGYQLPRKNGSFSQDGNLQLLHKQLQPLASIIKCVFNNWMPILVGPSSCGKTSCVRLLAHVLGQNLHVLNTSSAMDTSDLVGGFEQSDLYRHLESILERLESMFLESFRNFLLNDSIKTTKLLEQWKQLQSVMKKDIRLLNPTEEVQLFTDKLNTCKSFLMNMVSGCSDEDNKMALSCDEELLTLFSNAENKLAKSQDLHSGGGFQWVDSVLVKSLHEGSWLLVDNVNFCSSSVLDRLNALLEHNGVLTVSERGVVDGHVPTIKPHPDFRLILAMNPHNGEISRAMRNRGVEICFIDEDYDDWDISSMMSGLGLISLTLQQALIKVHDAMKEHLPISERPSSVDLLGVTSLTLDELQRGTETSVAIRRSCERVYLHPRKNWNLKDILTEAMEGFHSGVTALAGPFMIGRDLCTHSYFSTVKQEAYLLETFMLLLQGIQFPVHSPWTELIPVLKKDPSRIPTYLGLMLYQRAKPCDIVLRKTWLRHLIRDASDDLQMAITVLSETQCHLLNSISTDVQNVFDPRWWWRTVSSDNELKWNSVFLLQTLAVSKNSDNNQVTINKTATVCQLSDAHMLGTSSTLGPHPSVSEFVPMLGSLDMALEDTLRSGTTNDKLDSFMDVILCRAHLARQGALPVNKASIQHTVALLNWHWTRIRKKILRLQIPLLEKVLLGIQDVDRTGKISNKMRTLDLFHMELPACIENEMQLQKLNCNLSLWEDLSVDVAKVEFLICKEEIWTKVSEMWQCWRNGKTDLTDKDFTSINSTFSSFSQEISDGILPSCTIIPSQLWPLREYFFLLHSYTNTLCYICPPPSIPPIIAADMKSSSDLCRHVALLQHIKHSSATVGVNKWFHQRKLLNEELTSNVRLPITAPLISYYVELIVSHQPGLGEYEEKKQVLQYFRNALLCNANQLQDEMFNIRLNDMKLALHSASELILSLWTAVICPLMDKEDFAEDMHLTSTAIKRLPDLLNSSVLSSNIKQLLSHIQPLLHPNKHNSVMETAELWVTTGCLTTMLFSQVGIIDPLHELKLKFNYAAEELSERKLIWELQDLLEKMLTGHHLHQDTVHPSLKNHFKICQKLQQRIDKLGNKDGLKREDPNHFHLLKQMLQQYITTLGSLDKVTSLVSKMTMAMSDLSSAKKVISEVQQWEISQNGFLCQIKNTFGSDYQDLTMPFILGLLQTSHGIHMACDHLLSAIFINELGVDNVEDVLLMLQFPSHHDKTSNELQGTQFSQLLTKLTGNDHDVHLCLLKISLEEVRYHILSMGQMDESMFLKMSVILNELVSQWNVEEGKTAQKKADEENLFVFKDQEHCKTLSEEEQLDLDISTAFPTYNEEFDDEVKGGSIIQKKHFDQQQMAQVCFIHMDTMFESTSAAWLVPETPTEYNALPSFKQRYDLVGHHLLQSILPHMNQSLDSKLLPVDLIILSQAINPPANNENEERKSYDFYHDSNVAEVLPARHILQTLVKKIQGQLLVQFPDHPLLKQIVVLCYRVLAIPVISPVMKFLTGMEKLLGFSQDWEVHAHQAISIMDQLEQITEQIIIWRKLEMHCWKNCMETTQKKVENDVAKWWFHVYSVVQSTSDVASVIPALCNFMDKACLGDYRTRLQVLKAFHCHLIHKEESKTSLCHAFWNIHNYYLQFESYVLARLQSLRKPIEKKLKDFVKIHRWSDINYWAAKKSVEKMHRTLHKYIREFEAVLIQPVQTLLLDWQHESGEKSGSNDKFLSHLVPTPRLYVTDFRISDYSYDSVDSILSRIPRLLLKSQKVCKETVLSCPYPSLVQRLDLFVGESIDTVRGLQAMDVSADADEKKRKAEVRHIHQCRRKALSDLFKQLKDCGLSYRKGVNMDMTKEKNLQGPPVDIEAILSYGKSRPSDPPVLGTWQGCQMYYQRCMCRMDAYQTRLKLPAKELGPQTIDRLKGFMAHLMHLTMEDRKFLSSYMESLTQLRLQLDQLEPLTNQEEKKILPPQEDVKKYTDMVVNVCISASITLHQFSILLDTFPMNSEDGSAVPSLSQTPTPLLLGSCKGDEVWEATKDKVNILIQQFKKILLSITCPKVPFVVEEIWIWKHCNLLGKSTTTLQNISQDLKMIVTNMKYNVLQSETSLTAPLIQIAEKCDTIAIQYQQWYNEVKSKQFTITDITIITVMSSELGSVINDILVSIQQMFQLHQTKGPVNGTCEIDEDDSYGVLEENHLKKLTSGLNEELGLLQVHHVANLVRNIVAKFKEGLDVRLLINCLPIIHQYYLLCQFYLQQKVSAHRTVCKMLSVLLGVFIPLTEKGFCLPPEVLEECEEGEDGVRSDGVGLGDGGGGEGAKDVSDRIESEDQLEDALKPGEEQKQAEDDVKEEDGGIEMSEDFGGKLQDVETNEEKEMNDDDSSSEDEEIDKEMGQVEREQQTLDEKVWGGDSDSEDDGEDKQKEDEHGKGEEGKKKRDLVAMEEEQVQEEQVDKQYGKDQLDADPEPLDLPDDLHLDEKEKENAEEENAKAENVEDKDEEEIKKTDEEENISKNNEDNPEKITNGEDDTIEDSNENENSEVDDNKMEDGEDNNVECDDENKIEDCQEKEMHDDEENKMEDGQENKIEDGEEKMIDGEDKIEDGEDKMEDEEKNKMEDGDEQVEAGEEKNMEEVNDETENEDQKTNDRSRDMNVYKDPTQPSENNIGGSDDKNESAKSMDAMDVGNEETYQDKEGIGECGVGDTTGGNEGSSLAPPTPNIKQDSQMQQTIEDSAKRVLADKNEPATKRLKTAESSDKRFLEGQSDSNLHQHITQDDKEKCTQALLPATQEEADNSQNGREYLSDEEMEEDKVEGDPPQTLKEESFPNLKTTSSSKVKTSGESEEKVEGEGNLLKQEIEGENTQTIHVARSMENTAVTQDSDLIQGSQQMDVVTVQGNLWTQVPATNWNSETESISKKAWSSYEFSVTPLAMELCEQLRLVMEPSQASQFKGDYRTGKRINMRKVIPYIASQFRKDKIWLRRTKPNKRNYQIVLAIDDSSSMADNQSKQLAFESLALISKALSLLEAGALAVVSFGEEVKVVQSFSEQCDYGAKYLQHFTFQQKKTRVAELVIQMSAMLQEAKNQVRDTPAQVLFIVSDGRGIFNEGMEYVKKSVRDAHNNNILMVFLVIDNPMNKDSILDIRLPLFKEKMVLEISSYMDHFPFPYYIILRDINSLPQVLSDALRQWFELVNTG